MTSMFQWPENKSILNQTFNVQLFSYKQKTHKNISTGSLGGCTLSPTISLKE